MLEFNADLLQYTRLFGLIGYPLSHSFSKKYFTEKFAQAGFNNTHYELFPLRNITELPQLICQYPNLCGLNVTIPYKEAVLPYLNALDEGAQTIGAVNTIRIVEGRLTGYNTDAYGFADTLQTFLTENQAQPARALILGGGGAAKAVQFVLNTMGIAYATVSRDAGKGDLSYDQLDCTLLAKALLIINTTPLGMAPHIATFPDIPYHCISNRHLLYDLVYNPAETRFLQKGLAQGAAVLNGLPMLHAEAEKAWEIWNK